ncbi:unnamed protein product [Cercospora beticola]|nr:unnamed protein product [Cercospora beticola]
MNSTYRQALKVNIRNVMNVTATDRRFKCGGGKQDSLFDCSVDDSVPFMFSYLAWLGAELPFSWPNSSSSAASMTSPSQSVTGRRPRIDDHTLGLAVFPRAMHDYGGRYWLDNPWENATLIDEVFQGATLLSCKFQPSKYTLRFAYEGVAQTQRVQVMSVTHSPGNVDPCTIGAFTAYLNSSDAGLTIEHCDCEENKTYADWSSAFAKQTLSEWSYTAAITAFASLITGGQNTAGAIPGSAILYGSNTDEMKTQIFPTVLSDTIELAQISSHNTTLNATYANSSSDNAYEQALSLSRPHVSSGPSMSLSNALEELFFNISISFASCEKLRYNISNPFAPPPVDVTFKTYGNIYAYDSSKLWLTYGLAIGVTILNVIFGLVSIFHTGASFTANFSSIIRIAKNASIDVNMTEPNLPGKDPCPKDVAEAQLVVDSQYGDMPGKHGVRDLGSISTTYKPVEQTVREVESEQESLRSR